MAGSVEAPCAPVADARMPGRRHVAAPGEPPCPADGCGRPAGFATAHAGEGYCRRHDSHPPRPSPSPTPTRERAEAAFITPATPLDRRLTGERTNPSADPLAVLRSVLASARRAGYPFEQAWSIGAEAALSYMTRRRAEEWWEALTDTERAWADAYAGEDSRLEALTRS